MATDTQTRTCRHFALRGLAGASGNPLYISTPGVKTRQNAAQAPKYPISTASSVGSHPRQSQAAYSP